MTTRRILMRGGKPPHLALSPGATLLFSRAGVFTSNVGNLVFPTAVYRHLKTPATQLMVDGMMLDAGLTLKQIARLNEQADVLVLPLADAFRRTFVTQLKRLTKIVANLTIPVVVIGAGGRAMLTDSLDAVEPVNQATKRFVGAVLDHSASIGVRGERTADYLRKLGFGADSVEVIGCPSMFDLDHAGVIEKPDDLAPNDPMALTLSPYIPGVEKFLAHNMASYPGITYLPQGRQDLRLLLWREPFPDYPSGLPGDPRHPVYRDGRMAMCVDLRTWSGLVARQRFAFGTRIHGTIVALHAGTPAFLLAHDSRTLELAEYHEIPHLRITEAGPHDALELFERADFTRYNAVWGQRRAAYARFLERNGLDHTLGGERDRAYDARLAAARLPGPVRPRQRRFGPIGDAGPEHRRSARQAAAAERAARQRGDLW